MLWTEKTVVHFCLINNLMITEDGGVELATYTLQTKDTKATNLFRWSLRPPILFRASIYSVRQHWNTFILLLTYLLTWVSAPPLTPPCLPPAGVSNWGGYAVACGLYLLHTCPSHQRYLKKGLGLECLPPQEQLQDWTANLPSVDKVTDTNMTTACFHDFLCFPVPH